MRDKIYVALVHYPVYNKNDEIVATSVTNFDIHDISRTCRTYDIKKYFIEISKILPTSIIICLIGVVLYFNFDINYSILF